MKIPFTLDGVVSLVSRTLLNPILGLCYLSLLVAHHLEIPSSLVALHAAHVPRKAQFALAATAAAAVVLRLLLILDVRWRNGLLGGLPRLDAEAWKRQVVVVTGGSSGLGADITRRLLKKGAKVAVLDVAQPPQEFASEVLFVRCDVSDRKQVDRAADEIREKLGAATILINNAGIVVNKLILDADDSDLDRTFGINVRSHFLTIQAFLPDMLRRGEGHIVATISSLGFIGAARITAYVASKHALVGMMESLRYELDKKYGAPHIRTTVLYPGHMRTPLFHFAAFDKSPLGVAHFLAPLVEPDELARRLVEGALAKRQSRAVCAPFYVHLAPAVKLLPSWARDVLQWVRKREAVAADDAMTRPASEPEDPLEALQQRRRRNAHKNGHGDDGGVAKAG